MILFCYKFGKFQITLLFWSLCGSAQLWTAENLQGYKYQDKSWRLQCSFAVSMFEYPLFWDSRKECEIIPLTDKLVIIWSTYIIWVLGGTSWLATFGTGEKYPKWVKWLHRKPGALLLQKKKKNNTKTKKPKPQHNFFVWNHKHGIFFKM